ncbi:MAG: UDP-N-acetylmuramate--L-alanine ligase [Fibrobacter sp.]|nr:UDP-N-acetylmuramate--L-alanine ligase [Fibrobacter sp.]
MSGIAEVLHANGFNISGSDPSSGPVVQYLRNLGINIFSEHQASNVEGVHLVVYSSAVSLDNPEIVEAQKKKIPVIRRAEMLGELMRLKNTMAVAGTHGKTTTTSMVGAIWELAELDPTVIVGGIVKGRGTGALFGQGKYLIAEADEYDRSFLDMMPSSTIITNIDVDHLDCYGSLDEIKQAFIKFANKVPFYGQVVICGDDANCQDILSHLRKTVVTYGFGPQNDYRVQNLSFLADGSSKFEVFKRKESLGEFILPIPGRHNVLNALGALALSNEEHISLNVVRRALADFSGVNRRFELLAHTPDDILVYDDYAHHPTEVKATLEGVREAFAEKRVVVVFQPHLYSRTQEQYENFGTEFLHSDLLLVTDIYGAREEPIDGVNAELIVESTLRKGHKNAHAIGSLDNAITFLQKNTQTGDVVLFMGAGNIWKWARKFVEENP